MMNTNDSIIDTDPPKPPLQPTTSSFTDEQLTSVVQNQIPNWTYQTNMLDLFSCFLMTILTSPSFHHRWKIPIITQDLNPSRYQKNRLSWQNHIWSWMLKQNLSCLGSLQCNGNDLDFKLHWTRDSWKCSLNRHIAWMLVRALIHIPLRRYLSNLQSSRGYLLTEERWQNYHPIFHHTQEATTWAWWNQTYSHTQFHIQMFLPSVTNHQELKEKMIMSFPFLRD